MRVCGIAGFLLFELKSAESVENTGLFRCATEWHTVCKKTFGFPWFRAVASFISSFGKTSSHYTWTKECRFGGYFGKNFANARNFYSRVMPYAPVKIRSATLHGCSPKGSLTLLPQHEGRKNDTFFQIFLNFFGVLFLSGQHAGLSLIPEGRKNDTFVRFFSKFFWRPLSLRPACRIVAYTSNDRRTHNTKAARLIPDRDKQAADD